MADENGSGITKGWKYRIKNTREEEFSGIFKGYTMIGAETALIVTGPETMYIPISNVVCITLLEEGKSEPEEKKKEEPGVNYG